MSSRAEACAWAIVAILLSPALSAGQDLTAKQVVDLIVRDGPRARAIRAGTEVVRREQAARLAYPNPGLSYSREGAGFTEFFQAEQALPIFGVRPALERAGVAAAAAVEAGRDAQLWELRVESELAVARLISEQSRVDAAQAYTSAVEGLIQILRTRENEGEGSRFDRLRAEQELREARLVVTAAAIAATGARGALVALLPAGTVFTRILVAPEQPLLVPAMEALVARAIAARAELRAAQHSGEHADLEAVAARRSRRPVPTIFGGLKRSDTNVGRENGVVFGINAQVPLFDGGDREAARWDAERLRIDAERAAIEQQIRGEVTQAAEVLALRQAALGQDQAEGAEELTRIAGVAYREGEIGIVELLDAARTATRARTRSLDLRLELRLAAIALERAVGDTLWP